MKKASNRLADKHRFNILIADDDLDQLRLLTKIFAEKGYQVRHAINGSMALTEAFASPPDLILLDLIMPDVSGYQVCEKLKNHFATTEIPIICLSDINKVCEKVKAFNKGADDYICKPYQIDELLVRVENKLNLTGAKKELKKLNIKLEEKIKIRTRELENSNKKLIQEIERRKIIEQELSYKALYDDLTGLTNRSLLMVHIEQAIKNSQRHHDQRFGLLFVDVDRFKIINDSLGHLIGDKILIKIANCLKNNARINDTVARVGGDEFVVLLTEISNIDDVIKFTERIQKEINQPIIVEENKIKVTASIGIYFYNDDISELSIAKQAQKALSNSDIAMYRAKSKGQGLYEIFDFSMHSNLAKKLKLEHDLQKAIEREQFVINYQTIVCLDTQKIKGFEALIRWYHHGYDLISPNEFIPIAEETDLIILIDFWVLKKACYQLSIWQKQFRTGHCLQMSINISAKHFSPHISNKFNLVQHIDRILAETGLNGESIKLEMTERVFIENTESALIILQQLKERNIQLCLDDFGTGYSSLSYLYKFPFDIVKIDRSFVNKMLQGQKNHEIVKAIINLASNLGMEVIAEGIETEEQHSQLRMLACNYGQGYLFSRPIDSSSIKIQ